MYRLLDGQRRNCYNPPKRKNQKEKDSQPYSRNQLLHHIEYTSSRNSTHRLMDRLKHHTHFEQVKMWVQEKGNKQKERSFSYQRHY